jgi:hypothetical protein
LTGVSHLSDAEPQSIIQEVQGECCWLNNADEIKGRLLYAFLEQGYFKAQVLSLDILHRNPRPDYDTVAVAANVDEGLHTD